MPLPGLSKSTFLMGRQCSKLLWFRYNAKDQIPAPDESQQAVFDQGHEVGELAKKLFPDGIEIDSKPADFDGALRLTQEALKQRRPIYEATFSFGSGYARADSREFLRVTFSDVPAAERQQVRKHLEAYCALDTLGMVQIVEQLKNLTT
jgi:hypothetical protein